MSVDISLPLVNNQWRIWPSVYDLCPKYIHSLGGYMVKQCNTSWYDLWPTLYDLWPTLYDLWPTLHDLWLTLYDLWPTLYDFWPTLHDLWPTLYDPDLYCMSFSLLMTLTYIFWPLSYTVWPLTYFVWPLTFIFLVEVDTWLSSAKSQEMAEEEEEEKHRRTASVISHKSDSSKDATSRVRHAWGPSINYVTPKRGRGGVRPSITIMF